MIKESSGAISLASYINIIVNRFQENLWWKLRLSFDINSTANSSLRDEPNGFEEYDEEFNECYLLVSIV